MSRSPDLRPFVGQIVLVTTNNRWAITLTNASGSTVPIEEVFLASVLAQHLQNAGAVTPKATLDRTHAMCVVAMQVPRMLDAQARKLLGVLKTHYGMHKGLSVNWSVL